MMAFVRLFEICLATDATFVDFDNDTGKPVRLEMSDGQFFA